MTTPDKAVSDADSRIMIGAEVTAICRHLGLEPRNVARLDIRPRKVTAEVYKLRNGDKYIENGEPAVEWRTFKVET